MMNCIGQLLTLSDKLKNQKATYKVKEYSVFRNVWTYLKHKFVTIKAPALQPIPLRVKHNRSHNFFNAARPTYARISWEGLTIQNPLDK